ncbi:hypothetical protein N7488_009835 [Penicillium malachiteum]|nr:hypothetical protein N7488_009835 [Penicillium malachiteum]
MPESPIHNQPTNIVAGGTSATPTPANNVGGGSGWGDPGFRKGGTDGDDDEPRQGYGHVEEPWERRLVFSSTKTRAKYHFLQRSDEAADEKPMSAHGEPTCASEDHSFMSHRPGGSKTMPGWGTMRNVMGAMGGHSS